MTEHEGVGPPFSLAGRVAVVTGGAGLLGRQHARAIASAGGVAILADREAAAAERVAAEVAAEFGSIVRAVATDITDEASVSALLATVLRDHGRVDVLVNNAANNPKVEGVQKDFAHLENFPMAQWQADVAVGLTGAFLCAKVIGTAMAEAGRGTIINISSEYGRIAPDQRLYHVEGAPPEAQPKKPVSYTVVKAGLHGLTIYLATYWAERGVRANTLTVGGVENGQPRDFVLRAASKIPLGRMGRPTDYQGALVFLASDASAFMTGANLVVDGGKSTW
jgi:NAD(P)-dependent dehydrogenase (short-subunit alcohol dehydrogenase family)